MKHSLFRPLFLFMTVWCALGIAYEPASSRTILDYVQKHLPLRGTLQSDGKFVYVKIEDDYVHALTPLIQEKDFHEPPYFGKPGLVGAHITVINLYELRKLKMQAFAESGETIEFTLKACDIMHPPHWHKGSEVYVIQVDAPRLQEIRKRYGLAELKYPFHITVARKDGAKR